MTGPIVVGVEASEDPLGALALAGTLARVLGTGLILVNAYPWEGGLIERPEYETLVRETAERLLAGLSSEGRGRGAATRCIPTFSAAHALHDVAEAEHAAAIVLGATGRALRGRVALGSVAERLLSGAPCPVVVAPRGYAPDAAAGAFQRIGVAFVPGDQGHAAVRAAGLIAARTGTTVGLIEVADPRIWAADARIGRADASELAQAQKQVVEQHLAEGSRSLPAGVAATTLALVGDPAEELRGASAELDLLVCGSRAYGPVTGVLAGGVSKVLMHGARCPVMVVPRGNPDVFAFAAVADRGLEPARG